jgi:outer membrane protein OmpA-like peptidoglycan-associated protein
MNNRIVTQRLMVDGAYAKLYLDDTRVANVPVTKIPRGKRISFHIYGYEASPIFFGNIRVMAGGKKLYDALLKSGRVATQGIYFDTGSDRLRGESSATLKEIAQMLTEHADLRLTIEGHTDNVGAAASNQALSERRAAAVRAALVRNYGVAEDRLTSAGFGDAKPVAPNTAEEGRQQNRRVELVRAGP